MTQLWYATLRHPKTHSHTKFEIPASNNIRRYAPETIILKTRSEVKVKVTKTRKWYVTPSSQHASTHQIWNSYLKEYRRYAPDTKRDGRTDGRTVRLLYASQSSFGGIKIGRYFTKYHKTDFLIHFLYHPFCLRLW